jgi:hypothetical protein
MNLNRKPFLKAEERAQSLLDELKQDYEELKLKPVFSRFGPHSGQCDMTTDLKKITLDFPEMLSGDAVWAFRDLLFKVRFAEKGKDKETFSNLREQANQVERRLLDPDLKLYCGDVLIEFRPGILKYESLRRLQQDSRLLQDLNEVGNVRVVAGSLEFLAGRKK